MGIPCFYRWLLQTYPVCKEDNPPNGIKCDNLYLDMNQIIHNCAKSNDENKIIESVFEHIVEILSIVCPRQLLYMAIDGVTPRAKMTYQRTDRFLKSINISDGKKEKFLTNDRHQLTTETFDECNIKPGTKFMSELTKRLQNYIYDRMKTKQTWSSLKIILSDENVPGEGEHKIINFIRQQRIHPDYDPKTYHVIYSSDSDLVLLGLLTHERNFTIIREEFNDIMEGKYSFIDLAKLNDCLKDDLQKNIKFSFQNKPERSIDDWVFICLLFGNDFLPQSLSINFFGNNITMNDLIGVYKKIVEETKGYLTENATININRLIVFLKKVGEKDKDGKLRRQLYYKDKFDVNETQLGTFSMKIATDYVRGLCWVFQYYYQGPPSWNWYYPHYYAPLVYDFVNLKNVPLDFDENTKPFSQFEQMMATFSPQNVKYLPAEWQSLMLNSTSPIFNFYPRYFYVDPNGKRNSSQYVALLPFINEERLLEALQPVYSMLTSEEKKRNTRDHDRLFIHQKNLSDNFKKLSGNITENNPIQIQNILKGKLVGDVWLDDNDNIIHGEEDKKEVICFKYRDPLCYIESLEKIQLL